MIQKMNVKVVDGKKVEVPAGFWAVDPQGHICLMRVGAPLKAGWELATEADLKKAEEAEKARKAAEAKKAAELKQPK